MTGGRSMQTGQTKYGIGMTVSACLWLGLFPLLNGGSFSTITRDKWVIMFILTGVTVLCFLADLFKKRVTRPRPLALIAGGGLLLWILLSCLCSPYSYGPWWIGAGRRDGLASWLCYLGLFFLFSFSRVKRLPVLWAAGAGITVYFIITLIQYTNVNLFGLYPGDYYYDKAPSFQGTIGNVNMAVGYLMILCGLFLPVLTDSARALFRIRRKKEDGPARPHLLAAAGSLCVLAMCVTLLFTMDVSAGFLAFLVLLLWSAARLIPKKLRLPILALFLAAVLVLVWFCPFSSGAVWELSEILHGRSRFDFGSGRVGLWTYSMEMVRQEGRLLTGTGPDTYALSFNTFLRSYYTTHPDAEKLDMYYDNPHSEYIAMLINCGLPALLFFLLLIVGGCLGRPAWRDGVLAYAVQALFSFSVCIVAPMFWVVLGLAWSGRKKAEANN